MPNPSTSAVFFGAALLTAACAPSQSACCGAPLGSPAHEPDAQVAIQADASPGRSDAANMPASTEAADSADATTGASCWGLSVDRKSGLLEDFETTGSDQIWYRFGDDVMVTWSTEAAANGSGHGVEVTFGISSGGAGFGVPLTNSGASAGACTLDASEFVGLRFSAKGKGPLRVSVGDATDLPVADGGTCTRSGESCYDYAGFPIQLTDTWHTFEVPFCRMQPEGWGQQSHTIDTARLMALQFRHQPGAESHFALDEVSLYKQSGATQANDCTPACPLEAVQNLETVAPDQTYLQLTEALTLHTFEQATPHCGTLTRRYLEYRPIRLAPKTNAPIVLALHGRESSAEGFQDFMTHGSFDERAERSGAIVVYGNAAPGAESSSNSNFYNTGTWRQGANDDGQVDDVAYLKEVLQDMQRRGSIAGGNPVYLVGHSSGGGMAVNATLAAPELFSGVAPLFAYVGEVAPPVPALTENGIARVLFAYAPNDPGLPAGHTEILTNMVTSWAAELGVSETRIAAPTTTLLPNPIDEGSNYTGSLTVALATRNSSVTQLDFVTETDSKLRVVRVEHGGHFLPHPTQDTDPMVLENWGFRNQDITMADAIWDFFLPASVTP